jgi:hypothetical protein
MPCTTPQPNDPDLVARSDPQRNRTFEPRTVEQRAVGAGVDYESLIGCGVQPDLEVGAGDLGIVDHQPAYLADSRAFTTDKQLIKDRHATFRAAIVHDEVGRRLVGLPARHIDRDHRYRSLLSKFNLKSLRGNAFRSNDVAARHG